MSQGGIVQTFPSSLFQVGSVQLWSSAEAKLIALDMISSLAAANSTWRSIACPLCLSSSFSSSLFRFLCELAWRNMLTISRLAMDMQPRREGTYLAGMWTDSIIEDLTWHVPSFLLD